jgi:putative chitinase
VIERKTFFDIIRRSPFDGVMRQSQVDGINFILDEWERRRLPDLRFLAYMLATTLHETARTMQPIREFGKGHGRKYGEAVNGLVYYGRGYVQLTWDYNYKAMGDIVGVDLYNNPDLALDPNIAVKVMFEGMVRGTFTEKKLSQYFGSGVSDWVGARRVINGMDCAEEIAKIAKQFYAALMASNLPYPEPQPEEKPKSGIVDWLLSPFRRS